MGRLFALLCCVDNTISGLFSFESWGQQWVHFWAAGGVTKEMLAPFAMSLPQKHKKLLKCHNGSQTEVPNLSRVRFK